MPPKKLNIALLLDTSLDPPDGVQQYVLGVGRWLSNAGHTVHYLVGETKRTDIENVHSLSRNITVSFNGNKTTIPTRANTTAVKQLLAQADFDVLHVQTPHHPLMTQYIINHAAPHTAVIGTFHILPYNRTAIIANRLLGVLLRSSLKRIDTMLAVSSSAAKFEQQVFGRPADVLPNILDYDRFANALPLDEYTDDVLTILFLGRLVERKGCQYLLQAISLLDRSALPPFRVVICGKGELRPELEKYVADHNLSDCVVFTGYVSEEDKPRYYASADISVFPSTSGESFGIVLLEAMASGKSIVYAGNNPGYATVMETQPEQLFDPKDVHSLAALLDNSLRHPEARQTAAAFGREYVKQFDIEVVGPKLVACYENAIAKRRGAKDNNQ